MTSAAAMTLFCSVSTGDGPPKQPKTGVNARTIVAPLHSDLPSLIIENKNSLREQSQESMQLQEERSRAQALEHEIQKEIYDKNLIFRLDENSEPVLVVMQRNSEMVRIAEKKRALSVAEDAADDDSQQESEALLRYDAGEGDTWSLSGLGKINRFFRARFGRSLPVSALGQSHTHDRLGFDHSESVDVAVRPDSVEGRELIAYLRRTGIPFRAFRGKLSSVSTGAHIHIGRPSPRLVKIKTQARPAEERHEDAALS